MDEKLSVRSSVSKHLNVWKCQGYFPMNGWYCSPQMDDLAVALLFANLFFEQSEHPQPTSRAVLSRIVLVPSAEPIEKLLSLPLMHSACISHWCQIYLAIVWQRFDAVTDENCAVRQGKAFSQKLRPSHEVLRCAAFWFASVSNND